MGQPPTQPFPLVDRYMGLRMEVDLPPLHPGRVEVVESARRLGREQSYGFVHALWWIWLEDGRSTASVPPGAGDVVGRILEDVDSGEQIFDEELVRRLKAPIDAALAAAGLLPTDRVLTDLCFACSAPLLRTHRRGDCRRLTDESVPPAEGLGLPTHCFPDGVVYGVVADGRVVSVAYGHRSGLMEDQVADLGVETAAAYRRRGYAQTAVSAVVTHVARVGGEARYGCSPDNHASRATARSVGFVPYSTSLVLSTPAPDL